MVKTNLKVGDKVVWWKRLRRSKYEKFTGVFVGTTKKKFQIAVATETGWALKIVSPDMVEKEKP